jgi:hypothetical protein
MPSGEPRLTQKEVEDWRRARKDGTAVDIRTDRTIESLKSNLSGRDHLFFIDDSFTMSQMSDVVSDAFAIMSYIAKQFDPDSLELVFASSPVDVKKSSATSPLIDELRTHRYAHGITLMEHSMDQFMEKILMPRLRRIRLMPAVRTSVFIFTDGCWGEDQEKAAGVQRPIERLMTKILEQRIPRTQVMIQFVRFGDNAAGRQYLNYLDDFGEENGW